MQSIGWMRDALHARVYIDGDLIPEASWEYTFPSAGQSVCIRAVPLGGNQGKDALRIAATIAVIVGAIVTGGLVAGIGGAFLGLSAATWGGIAAAGVSIVGTLGVSALIPPAPPKLNELSNLPTASNTLSITGTSNQLLPYGVVPRVYGRHRVFPPHAAKPYSEVVGNDQYLRCAFCFGPGPLALSDFKIGESPLAFFQNVEVEVRQGYPTDPDFTLYPAAINEEPLSILVTTSTPAIRASQSGASELSIDVTFPEGLWTFHSAVGADWASIDINVEYRKQGETDWDVAVGRNGVAASMTTALPGANSNLVVTATQANAAGNNHALAFLDGGPRPTETLQAYPNGTGFVFQVVLRNVGGVYSTAAQIKAFLASADFIYGIFNGSNDDGFERILAHAADYLTVDFAPGNDGSGSVVPMPPTYLQGGLTAIPSLSLQDRRATMFRAPVKWSVPEPGIYEVRVTRLTTETPNNNPVLDAYIHNTFYWTALRTIRAHVRVMPAGMAGIALRIKATDQLNGSIDSFNAFAESIVPDWTGTSWVPRITNNPASIFRDIHQGTANARPKPDSRLDLPAIQGFHTRCASLGFTFNGVIDFQTTVKELARDVLAAGRATPGIRDGKTSVVEDIPQSIPVQMFTPRNSSGFKGTKIFADLPHALKVRFINAQTLQQDERVVLADGYGYTDPGGDGVRRDAFGQPTTLPEASRFETVEAGLGVTDPAQAFALQRYHMAALLLRPETFTLSADFEHLIAERGDFVLVQHDVPLMGLISGRVKTATQDSVGRTTTIGLDASVVMEAGKRYGVRIRLSDGTQIQREVQCVPGEQTTFTLLQPI